MSFESITNRGEFFSDHYLEAVLNKDIGDLRKEWETADGRGEPNARARLRSASTEFFAARATANEDPTDRRLDRLHDAVLDALGFTPGRTELGLKQNTEHVLDVPVAAQVETSTGLLLVAVEAGMASSLDELFDFDPDRVHEGGAPQPGQLRRPVFRNVDNRALHGAGRAVGEIFTADDPPRYVLLLGGPIVVLAERSKWAEGRYLAVDLGLAFDRNDQSAKGELETIAALFSYDALVPVDGQSHLELFVDNSHKHAVGVSKELRNGIRESIEILANEVIHQRDEKARAQKRELFTRTNVDARELTRQSLRYLYRLLVLLYAESRPELGIVPAGDEAYVDGYSLDRLRELCLVDLVDDHARTGSHFRQSLDRLFDLVNSGYHAEEAQLAFVDETTIDVDATIDAATRRSHDSHVVFPGLDAQLFDPKATSLLNEVELRNEALQKVLRNLMLAEGRKKNEQAGFISYAQLGINQLGAVYEGLMAYTGFYAHTDLFEVAKGGDPKDGTWMLPVADADSGDYPDDVFVMAVDPDTGVEERVRHTQGSFVFRLSGRDRQRSASYYTPEVLTRCVVKHALAELLGMDNYAPEHGSSGITDAVDILDLTICEPALGSGAFANEAINQLADVYLKRRQAELGEVLTPVELAAESQKVKAHFALHQTYGVDLNATAVELAEVSLWLNAMYPGLKAPWFGLQLRQGNSLIGCRRSTWTTSQLGDKPWKNTKKGSVQPPLDRPLAEPLQADEVHHFLFPGHGWAAVADRKEARELRPDETQALKDWRRKILTAPKRDDAKRLTALARGVEAMWASALERIRLTQRGLRRDIQVYGAPTPKPGVSISRASAEAAMTDPNSALGRLRTLMDAWVGLWFWPLDTGVKPPSWHQWLTVAEALVRPDERRGVAGQLDLFDDLDALLDAEAKEQSGQTSVAQLMEDHPWLKIATDAARREGAWHWDLEFAPIFQQGGFDLQIGNPPWVRPTWKDDLVLAEHDPWWGVADKPAAKAIRERREANLMQPNARSSYLAEMASAEGVVETLGSPILRPVLTGIQTNLYMVFMDTTWRNLRETGAVGMLHPESHFTDPKGAELRRSAYIRLRRHWQFQNEFFLFEDIDHKTIFGIHVYGRPSPIVFQQMSYLFHPDTADRSLEHSGSGTLPAIQYPAGGWDASPHRGRVVTITDEVLADWAKLFDEPGTPAAEARLLRPVTTADLEALSTLADQPVRLADHDYHWTAGWHEKGAKKDGTIEWRTAVPSSWDDVILQGPHFTVATPFSKQPNENCKHNQDYRDWDLEHLPEHVIPRTNYQRACAQDTYRSRLDHWNGEPNTAAWRFVWRRMTQPGLERSLQGAIVPPGPSHVNTCFSLAFESGHKLGRFAGLWSSLPLDYMVKVSGKADVQDQLIYRSPLPKSSPFDALMALRTLRLNCLTADYAPLWEELFDPSWTEDRWTDPELTRSSLGHVGSAWTMDTPLRRDQDRWQALVELDALAALMLGLTAEQLCAMYRTQFAVLRKYEYKMVFDAEGRKICGYHQSAGYRQSQLQDEAKAGDRPKEWKNLWNLYEQYEADPSSVDWEGHYAAPFTRVDREAAMTRAYESFTERHDVPKQ